MGEYTRQGYPLFVPPNEIATKAPREWNANEARVYFDWLTGAVHERVNDLLAYFRVCQSAAAHEVLSHAGERVCEALQTPVFAESTSAGPRLTNAGYAMAADIGLLVARFLLAGYPERVSWRIVTRPRSDASYNLPALYGFCGNIFLEPVGGSIAEASAVLRGQRDSDAWRRSFEYWSNKVLGG